MSTEFERHWEREFILIRSKIAPWDRKKMPQRPELVNEETVTQYVKAVKPLVERGKYWASIRPRLIYPFEVVRWLIKILYYFYLWIWTPMLCVFLIKELFWQRTLPEDLSAVMVMTQVATMVVLGLPVVFVYRSIRGIEL